MKGGRAGKKLKKNKNLIINRSQIILKTHFGYTHPRFPRVYPKGYDKERPFTGIRRPENKKSSHLGHID